MVSDEFQSCLDLRFSVAGNGPQLATFDLVVADVMFGGPCQLGHVEKWIGARSSWEDLRSFCSTNFIDAGVDHTALCKPRNVQSSLFCNTVKATVKCIVLSSNSVCLLRMLRPHDHMRLHYSLVAACPRIGWLKHLPCCQDRTFPVTQDPAHLPPGALQHVARPPSRQRCFSLPHQRIVSFWGSFEQLLIPLAKPQVVLPLWSLMICRPLVEKAILIHWSE